MKRAVEKAHLHVDQRVAAENALGERLFGALPDRGDELLGHHAADDAVLEHETGAALQRRDLQPDVAVLPAPAALADEAPLAPGGGAQRLAVGDLRAADARLDAEFALEPVDDDLEVQLAHAGDERLPALLVGADLEGRVLVLELVQGAPELVLVGLAPGLDGDRDHRLRENRWTRGRPAARGSRGCRR